MVAAAIIGGAAVGLAGSAISGSAAQSAAQTQAGAAENAQGISEAEFNTITAQQQPFMQAGYGALNALNQGLGIGTANPSQQAQGVGFGSLTQPFTAQNFQQLSPAYQFQLQQGQQGVLNSDSPSAGALSGSALKDLTGYNQSMANTSFYNAFNQYQTQQGNIYSRLSNIANLGQNAAANTGQAGTALAGQAAQSATNVGTALAGGTVGAANAYSSGLSNTANMGLLGALYGGGASPGDSTAVTYNTQPGTDEWLNNGGGLGALNGP
jgi:hypothetical protein